uniref:Protein kinase domain-containing protein n=1 Tax=Alexandrium monilatum TaxID=311494 RepID=A0A7S4QXK1_9DINO
MAAAAGDDGEASGERALQLLRAPGESLGRLSALVLRGAGLSVLPDSIGHCSQLVRLDVGGNQLQDLPAALSSLPRLKILFASGGQFQQVPPVLADCAALRMVGFNNNRLTALECKRLPEGLEWLIAAGNQIEALHDIGRLKHVRKLMLSHNRLTCAALAPAAGIEDLEMIRVAANQLEAFPAELLRHPRLSWVAVGGNPFAEACMERRLASAPPSVDFAEIELGGRLGSGAGATVYTARWRGRDVAVKLWDGERFSDGTARGEWAVNRVAGHPGHPSLVGVLGTFEEPRPGMVLEKIDGAVAAASPPAFDPWTVTRDVVPAQGGRGPSFTAEAALRIAQTVAQGCEYMHSRGLLHGDVYLHNTLVVPEGPRECSGLSDARLSDFGAAAAVDDPALLALEVRSFGWMLQDLLELLAPPPSEAKAAEAAADVVSLLRHLRGRCARELPEELPTFADLAAALAAAPGEPKPAL